MIYKEKREGDTILEYIKIEWADGLFYMNRYFNKKTLLDCSYVKDVFTNKTYRKRMWDTVDNIYAYKVLEQLEKYNLKYIIKWYNNSMVILHNIRELYLKPHKWIRIYAPYLWFVKQLKNRFIINEWILRTYKSWNSYTINWEDLDYCLSLFGDKYKFIYNKRWSIKRKKCEYKESIYKNKWLFMDAIKWIKEWFDKMNNWEDVNIPQFEKALTQWTVLDIIELLSSNSFVDTVIVMKKNWWNQYPFNFIKEV